MNKQELLWDKDTHDIMRSDTKKESDRVNLSLGRGAPKRDPILLCVIGLGRRWKLKTYGVKPTRFRSGALEAVLSVFPWATSRWGFDYLQDCVHSTIENDKAWAYGVGLSPGRQKAWRVSSLLLDSMDSGLRAVSIEELLVHLQWAGLECKTDDIKREGFVIVAGILGNKLPIPTTKIGFCGRLNPWVEVDAYRKKFGPGNVTVSHILAVAGNGNAFKVETGVHRVAGMGDHLRVTEWPADSECYHISTPQALLFVQGQAAELGVQLQSIYPE